MEGITEAQGEAQGFWLSPDLLLGRPTKKRGRGSERSYTWVLCFWGCGQPISRVEEVGETGMQLFQTLKYFSPALILPGLSPVVFEARESMCVCVLKTGRGWVFALFANTVQPNRRQITFCGGVCPVPMAEFVRFEPLDNKSCHPPPLKVWTCHRWQLKQALHSL